MNARHLLLLLSFAVAACAKDGDDTDDSGEDTDTEDTSEEDACATTQSDGVVCHDASLAGCALPTSAGSDSLAFLNQCTDSSYVVFDNAARIPASTWVPGTSLPPV